MTRFNTLATATLFQTQLDEAAVQTSLTGWMENNAGQVIYNGGAEVKIPIMSTQGLGNYDRDKGYKSGKITLKYETKTMTQDRGRSFSLDAMDVNETNFVATASRTMGIFQRESVTPEIDAYRISALATAAINNGNKNVVYGYTPAESTIVKEIKKGIAKIRDNGYNGRLMIHITSTAKLELELALGKQLSTVTFSKDGVDMTVPAIDGNPLIETPQNRMWTAIKINDGESHSQEDGGYAKGVSAKDINFLIVPENVPVAISKQDKMRIFDPDTNQKANAWAFDYRRFHDLWVLDNKLNSIYLNIKDPESPEAA